VDAILKMTDIASFTLTQKTMEIAVHGSQRKFSQAELQVELLLNKLSKENSRFASSPIYVDPLQDSEAFNGPEYKKNFFKTPLQVNNCAESLYSLDYTHPDFGALKVASSLLTTEFLLKSIREK